MSRKKIGVGELRRLYESGEKIVSLTAYDAQMAEFADECGMHFLLVGDSLGMTVLGYETTIPVTLEQVLHHTAAVVRGTKSAMVVGDMPFLTYQITHEEALRNAGRFLQEAGADAVKLEGGVMSAPVISRLVQAGIPVMGHIGLLPQSVLTDGGYRVHGRTAAEAESLKADAKAVEAAGAFAVVLEGVPRELSAEITASLSIPTIGIGAGSGCSGQIQVVNDILGLFTGFQPRHAKKYVDLGCEIRKAFAAYRTEVQEGTFPSEENSF
jgi:3-methyl-2-oxobutanoate hydroxymethyltransferase